MNAATAAVKPMTQSDHFEYVLRLADTSLVLAQRLGEWVGHAPALEEDLGFGNLALDFVGQARLLLTHAGEIEGKGRSEDDLAYLRDGPAFRNLTLVEQPNGDFAHTIVRQLFVDAFQIPLFEGLIASRDSRLAGIAEKALKESRYHLRFSGNWLLRLGDGTEESHRRAQAAADDLIRFVPELFDIDAIERAACGAGIAPDPVRIQEQWRATVGKTFGEATLTLPALPRGAPVGKRGDHSEHLGYLLSDLQFMQRAYPGATW